MEKEIENLIEELTKVRPSMLNEEALKLFNTIMAVLDERDNLISKIKEKIEELNGMIYLASKGELTRYTVSEIILAQKILQELMEEK